MQHLVSFVADRGARQLLRRGPRPGADAGGRQQERGAARTDLGVRLFHRSTRRLALTESGERFLQQVDGRSLRCRRPLPARAAREEPAGTLKVSMGQAFGRHFLVPLLGDFLARYPRSCPTGISTTARSTSSARASMPRSAAASRSLPASSRASWRRCTSSPWRRRPTWPAGRCRAPRDLAASTASCAAPRRPAAYVPGPCARAARRSRRSSAGRAHPQRPRGHRAGGAARARRRPPADAVRRSPPSPRASCFRLLPGWYSDAGLFRCTTRAAGCCRPRPGSSSTSSSSAFDRRISRGWSMAARLARSLGFSRLHAAEARRRN